MTMRSLIADILLTLAVVYLLLLCLPAVVLYGLACLVDRKPTAQGYDVYWNAKAKKESQ
jgi:hypothetical protein